MKKELSKEQQIEILEKVLTKLKQGNYFRVFLCCNIVEIINIKYGYNTIIDHKSTLITPYIPIFSRKNATIACNELGLKPPYKGYSGGWWGCIEVDTRIKVLEWMINKLKID